MKSITQRVGSVALLSFLLALLAAACGTQEKQKSLQISHDSLMDKVKGGWAGQTIGVTYGGPTEFRYLGRTIGEDVQVAWGDEDYILNTMKNNPGLYDDIYMDLTFVEVFEHMGIDAPVEAHALAFANAEYPLWHANQAARYNILNGIMPPASGHWRHNAHADDIDYQIEADYAGLMSPAMPNAASAISDKIGHIMNYGDGWYGGVFVGAMYSMAFISQDMEYVVSEALKCIPQQSKFYRCINDVIKFWRKHPDDWRAAWQMCHEKWDNDIACPEGVVRPFNIDASLNSAYIVIGLLYGGGDFGRTIDIAMRCGQDSDCNPASAGGILGTAIGYDNIPEEWLAPLRKAEDIKFAYTNSSLNDTYRMSFKHAILNIIAHGGKIQPNEVVIPLQQPQPVALEQMPAIKPRERIGIHKPIAECPHIEVECAGIAVCATVKSEDKEYVARIEVRLDGGEAEVITMPADWNIRRLELYHNFELSPGKHKLEMRWLNPTKQASVELHDAIVWDKN